MTLVLAVHAIGCLVARELIGTAWEGVEPDTNRLTGVLLSLGSVNNHVAC